MGRSNNQRRRTAKDKGKLFVPAWTKSKTKQRANKARVTVGAKKSGKLAYGKVVNKSGVAQKRRFQAGGFNNSGKFGKAKGNQARKGGSKPVKGAGKKGAGKK